MKKCLIIIFIILMSAIVTADKGLIEVYKPNEVFDLGIHLTNSSGDVGKANCSVQVRNESLGVILDDIMNEVGGGWYNYTYNNSNVGKYFCRQNCTKDSLYTAETCDFVIKGDENMNTAIIIAVMSILIIYLALIFFFTKNTTFEEHAILRLLFIVSGFWFLLLPLNIAIQINEFNGGSTIITTNLEILMQIMVWVNVLITFYFMLWFLVKIMQKLLFIKKQKEEGDTLDP